MIRKTEKSEYILTLTKLATTKKSFWACGKTNDTANTKKLHSVTLTNDLLNLITNKSFLPSGETYVKIEDFIEVDAKEFVDKLKKLTNVGLD
jgi:hypothetical protein